MKWFCGAAQIYLNELRLQLHVGVSCEVPQREQQLVGLRLRRCAQTGMAKRGTQPLSRTLVTYQNPTGNSELSLCGDQTLSQSEGDECQGEYPDLADRRVDNKYS